MLMPSATIAGKHYLVVLVLGNWYVCIMITLLVLLWYTVLFSSRQFGHNALTDLVIDYLSNLYCVFWIRPGLESDWFILCSTKALLLCFRLMILNGLHQVLKERGIDETAIGNLALGPAPALNRYILYLVCITPYYLMFFMLHLTLFNFPWVPFPMFNGLGSVL